MQNFNYFESADLRKRNQIWEYFENTGSIFDYLNYAQHKTLDQNQESKA